MPDDPLLLWLDWFGKSGGDPFVDDSWGGSSCFFCGIESISGVDVSLGKQQSHKPDCVFIRVLAMITESVRERIARDKEKKGKSTYMLDGKDISREEAYAPSPWWQNIESRFRRYR